MGISRRSLLLTAAAASTAGLLPTASARAAGGPPGDVVGRITVGYQGWFACPGDGAPINGWWHWSQDWSHVPSPRRLVLALPPAPAWAARTQTVAVLGSTDGTAFATLAGAAGYRFDPATGNTAVLTLPAAVQTRYLRLQFTGNTGRPAGQLSALQDFAQ